MTTHVRVNHAQVAERLRANPGQWGTVGEYRNAISADRTAYMVRAGRFTSGRWYQPAGQYETRLVPTDDGTRVEARYLTPDAVRPISVARRSRIAYLVHTLVVRQRLQRLREGIAAEARHQMDPAEGPIEKAFEQMACDHPEACQCDGGRP